MATLKAVIVTVYNCIKCGHEWESRKPLNQKPKLCPNCQNRKWEAPEKEVKTA